LRTQRKKVKFQGGNGLRQEVLALRLGKKKGKKDVPRESPGGRATANRVRWAVVQKEGAKKKKVSPLLPAEKNARDQRRKGASASAPKKRLVVCAATEITRKGGKKELPELIQHGKNPMTKEKKCPWFDKSEFAFTRLSKDGKDNFRITKRPLTRRKGERIDLAPERTLDRRTLSAKAAITQGAHSPALQKKGESRRAQITAPLSQILLCSIGEKKLPPQPISWGQSRRGTQCSRRKSARGGLPAILKKITRAAAAPSES